MISEVEKVPQGRESIADDKIDEVPESKEEAPTIQQTDITTDAYLDSYQQKREIVKKFYIVNDQQMRKKILASWPNKYIQDFLEEQGIIELKNQSFLVGNVINNMIEGFALVLYNNHRFYEGQFQNSSKHGHGFECLPNGIYIGRYVNNKPEGQGSFYWNNGEVYEGEFLAGLKHGNGKWHSQKQSYVGDWRSNKPDGYGVIITEESKYEGEVRTGLKHGQGKQTYKNGDKYAGGYVNGRPEGNGQYIWSKGVAYYRGGFKNGLRHGNGVWVQDGDRYEGHYLNDRKNGKGCFQWSSGNTYNGCYFDDLRHGYGQMKWSDGSWYKGQWKYGVQHGIGQICEKGRLPRRGIFQNNVLISEDDVNKVSRNDKKTNKLLPRKNISNEKHKILTLPDVQECSYHRRIPSFIQKKEARTQEKTRMKSHSSRPYAPSVDIKSLRKAASKPKDIRNTHHGSIVRNRSTIEHRQDSANNIIRWSNIRLNDDSRRREPDS